MNSSPVVHDAAEERDPSNEWDMSEITPTMRTTFRSNVSSAVPSTSRPAPTDANDGLESYILTVMPATCPAGKLVSDAMANMHVVEYLIDLDDNEQLDNLCDDTAFRSAAVKVKGIVEDPRCTAGVFIQPQMSIDAGATIQSNKESTRKAAAILLRTLALLPLLVSAGREALWIVPWPAGSK